MRFDKRKSKKAKSGYTWRVTFEYKDTYGHTQRYSKSGFPTKKAAEAHGLEMQKQLAHGVDIKAETTVDELFEIWLKLKPRARNTMINYQSCYKNHIRGKIGPVPIKDLSYQALQKLMDESETGYETALRMKKILKGIGDLAIKTGYISAWPIRYVEIKSPKTKKEESEYISEADFNHFVDTVAHGRKPFESGSRAMFLIIGYYTGLRISEIMGLTWDEIDFEKDVIHVRYQLETALLKISEYRRKDILKTDASYAEQPIPAPLKEALLKWREYNPYDFLICKRDGSFFHVESFRASLRKSAASIGLKEFRPHALRHTYITNVAYSGVDPKTLAALARHANPIISLAIYTEIKEEKKREAVEKAFSIQVPELKA